MKSLEDLNTGAGAARTPALGRLAVSLCALLACTSLAAAATEPGSTEDVKFAQSPLVIRATRVHVEGGEVIENGVVVILGSKISAVGAGVSIPKGAIVIEHEGDLTAGLVALREAAGAQGENYDSTRKLLPEAELVHAFDAKDSDFEALLREGVTSVLLTAPSYALAGGVTCVVKTDGGRVLRRRVHLSLSFSSWALSSNISPTSYGGMLAEFDRRLKVGKGSFGEAAAGKLPVLMEARSRHELQRSIGFAQKHGLKGMVSGAPLVGELAKELATAGLGAVLPSFSVGMDSRAFQSSIELAEAGVAFGFALDSPGNDGAALRTSAAACLRAGLGQAVAWRALTSDAAALAGAGKQIGRVAAGFDADIVLWSGPPLDLASRVVAVYVDGQTAYEAPEEEEDEDEEEKDKDKGGSN